jgi:hypothetical protein
MAFKAFENEDQVLNVGGDALTVENGLTSISLTGNLQITKDKAGLEKAKALQEALDSIVLALRNEKNLPDAIAEEAPLPTGTTKNPF